MRFTEIINKLNLDYKVYSFDSIDSTSGYLISLIKNDKYVNKSLCISDTQTKGRGRHARNWYSPLNKNLYLSLCYVLSDKLMPIELDTVIANALKDTLISQYKKNFIVKKPNDIFYEDKKLAGVLVEVFNKGERKVVVIGIGLNFHLDNADKKMIDAKATSLNEIIIADEIEASLLINSFIQVIERKLNQ